MMYRMRTEYVIPVLLIASVVRQVRGRRLTAWGLTWPIGVVVWAAATYLRGFPATPRDLELVFGCAAAGVALGALAGRCTQLSRNREGILIARATAATVALWSLGPAGRMLFALYAEHGGGQAIATFSAAHGLALRAWAAALTLMSLTEVVGRTAVLLPRALAVAGRSVWPLR